MRPKLSLFRRPAAPANPWHPEGAPYPPLAALDLAPLKGQSGLYAVWHLGVRPRWLRIGGAGDLASALVALKAVPDIGTAVANGGVFVAWAPQPPAAIPGAVAFLVAELKPFLQGLALAGEILAADAPATSFPLPPGTQAVLPASP